MPEMADAGKRHRHVPLVRCRNDFRVAQIGKILRRTQIRHAFDVLRLWKHIQRQYAC